MRLQRTILAGNHHQVLFYNRICLGLPVFFHHGRIGQVAKTNKMAEENSYHLDFAANESSACYAGSRSFVSFRHRVGQMQKKQAQDILLRLSGKMWFAAGYSRSVFLRITMAAW
jgi:hypothetical protein